MKEKVELIHKDAQDKERKVLIKKVQRSGEKKLTSKAGSI